MLKQPMCNHSVFRGFLVYLLTYAFLNGLFLLAEPALGGYHADHLIFLLFGHLICGSCVQYRFHLFKTFHWNNTFFLGAAIAFFPCLLYLLIRFFFMEVLSCLHVEPLTICTASTVAQLLPSAYRYCTFSIQLLFVHMKYALISTTLWSAAFLSGIHIVRYLQKNDLA